MNRYEQLFGMIDNIEKLYINDDSDLREEISLEAARIFYKYCQVQ